MFSRLLCRLLHVGNGTVSSVSQLEKQVNTVLRKAFPAANTIKVVDVSHGCGAMFEVTVECSRFKDLSKVQQHLQVTQALKSEIKDMHGIRIFTAVPKEAK